MALLPSVPTSFVPHAPGTNPMARARSESTSVLSFIAYGILFVTFVVAIGVFAYGELLKSQQSSKDAELSKAEAAIDPATVEGFVRLRNRLTYGKQEIAQHVAFSNFFVALENLLPATVRFSSLHLSVDPSGTALVEGAGLAKNFNALAALSNALAQDGRIKSAIFSKITVKGDGGVGFSLSATLDPKLIGFSATAPSSSSVSPGAAPVQMVNPTPGPSQ